MPAAAIIDIDGTLVDTNHLHVLAWQEALREHGYEVPSWRILHGIGMGGDQLVAHLIGDEADAHDGDAIRDAESERYQDRIDDARPLPGARDLLAALRDRGLTVVLASSAKEDEVEHYLGLLDARGLADGWTTSADVDRTKPHPDLVEAALGRAETRDAVMLGDTVWDMRAAARADVPAVGVRTGGIAGDLLVGAGAVAVYDDAPALAATLGASPFA